MYIQAEKVQKLVSLLVIGLHSDSDRNVTKRDKNEEICHLACVFLYSNNVFASCTHYYSMVAWPNEIYLLHIYIYRV